MRWGEGARPEGVLRLPADHKGDLQPFGVKRLAPFGSMVRGEAGPDSDVDPLVAFVGGATFDRHVDPKLRFKGLLGRGLQTR
ncbi:nucleotidyltransferase domain-containing protein [Thermus sp.]|uniref:nucleotidyltransferase family protein n=1 Tax=Thermus sp. TaxID=275 RepID=UPI0025D68506|nr:nucleotidyltransferase domain-containing protein [Thermus sp.]MCS6867803.1 nucleotidyltransferase domain-containing protein [Thermus sp.]